ncbi:MAG: O-antigen ligase family protein [Patescibacteria group bacterium]
MKKYREFTIFFALYFGVRLFSYYFIPGTPINTIVSVVILTTAAFFIFKKNLLGWTIVLTELLVGGSGTFFKIETISLRSVLLFASLTIYFLQNFRLFLKFQGRNLLIYLLILVGAVGAWRGYIFGNNFSRIISDSAPYLFILYYFPLVNLLQNAAWIKTARSIMTAAICGGAFFILFTFIGFGTSFFVLQDSYYHWFRDIAGGKITFVEFNFFRLVLNEQLLLAPVMLYFIFLTISSFRKYILITTPLLFLLAINLTRIYILSLICGTVVMVFYEGFKKSFKPVLAIYLIFLSIFISIFFISSGGKSLGLEVFGLRLQSIVIPNSEESSLSRLLLLPKIIEQIKVHPWLGSGLGSTITVFSPVLKQNITTPHYDWGYFEILSELGLFGFCIWILVVFYLLKKTKKQPIWPFVMLISLLVINITSPALFHVFGFIMLAFLLAYPDHVSPEQSRVPFHTPSPHEV